MDTNIAVTGSVDDDLAIHVLICPGERVRTVELDLTDQNYHSTGKVLWKIASPGGGPVSEFVVGQAPRGFTTTVPAEIPKDGQYFFVGLTTEGHGQGGFGLEFSRDDVSSNSLYTGRDSLFQDHDGPVTVEQFESVRGKVCAGQLKPLAG